MSRITQKQFKVKAVRLQADYEDKPSTHIFIQGHTMISQSRATSEL